MKNFQQNLLIVLALGLCGLCAFQWRAQTVQRNRIEQLNQQLYRKTVELQNHTNAIANANHQIDRLSAELIDLKGALMTNEQRVKDEQLELGALRLTREQLTNQVATYQSAVEVLKEQLNQANDGISRRNEALRDLVGQRDELVKKYNASIVERNGIVSNYNKLVERLERR